MGKNKFNYANRYNPQKNFSQKENSVSYSVEEMPDETLVAEETSEVKPIVKAKLDIPKGSFLNIREKKDTDSEVLKSISDEKEIVVLDDTDPDWAHICLENGLEGYVLKKFIIVL